MDPVKTFQETASSYGIGYAVLIVGGLGLLYIVVWVSKSLVASHKEFLMDTRGQQRESTAELKKQTEVLIEIKAGMANICQAECPAHTTLPVKQKTRPA